MATSSLVDILQSSGGLALDELNLRTSEAPEELAKQLGSLQKSGVITVSGPNAKRLSDLSADDMAKDSETVVELSPKTIRRTFSPGA